MLGEEREMVKVALQLDVSHNRRQGSVLRSCSVQLGVLGGSGFWCPWPARGLSPRCRLEERGWLEQVLLEELCGGRNTASGTSTAASRWGGGEINL